MGKATGLKLQSLIKFDQLLVKIKVYKSQRESYTGSRLMEHALESVLDFEQTCRSALTFFEDNKLIHIKTLELVDQTFCTHEKSLGIVPLCDLILWSNKKAIGSIKICCRSETSDDELAQNLIEKYLTSKFLTMEDFFGRFLGKLHGFDFDHKRELWEFTPDYHIIMDRSNWKPSSMNPSPGWKLFRCLGFYGQSCDHYSDVHCPLSHTSRHPLQIHFMNPGFSKKIFDKHSVDGQVFTCESFQLASLMPAGDDPLQISLLNNKANHMIPFIGTMAATPFEQSLQKIIGGPAFDVGCPEFDENKHAIHRKMLGVLFANTKSQTKEVIFALKRCLYACMCVFVSVCVCVLLLSAFVVHLLSFGDDPSAAAGGEL